MTDNRNGFLGAVGRFFFTPTDPTTLGLMRIVTGLLLLYVHAVYSLNLKDFFGPDAWWDHQTGNTQRRSAPNNPGPIGWGVQIPTLYIEGTWDSPHRRGAVVEFLRNLPAEPAARKQKLRFLEVLIARTQNLPGPAYHHEYVLNGLGLPNSAARLVDESQEERLKKVLASDPFDDKEDSPVFFPRFVREMPPQERQAYWRDVLTFKDLLPPSDVGTDRAVYVLDWLGNYPPHRRDDLYRFLIGEKKEGGRDLSLPTDPRERKEFLDYLETWSGDTRQAQEKGTAVFSMWYHLTDGTAMWAVHGVVLFVFLLFTVGLWTRVTSVLTWALSLCYIHRGQLTLFGQDTMQTILVTYLMIGPCGAALSLDALRARYRAGRALLGAAGRRVPWAEAILNGPQPSWLANFAVRLVQINFCFIYMSSGVSKLKGAAWWEHSAAWLVVANPEFGLIRYSWFESFLRFLVEYRFLTGLIAGSVSVFTLFVEIGLPFLVWTRLRPLMVALSAMLHLGIGIIMGLAVFSMYMYALLLAYFPARLIRERVGYAPGSGRKMSLEYDHRDAAAVRKAALVRAFDVAGQVTFVDTGTGKKDVDRTIHLTDPEGRQLTGRDLYATALRELVLLRPVRWLGHIPGVWAVVSWWFR
ncbi:MAG TPA: hypothetical protein VKD90_08715 [Gemmataceae bacterium]|nr:hypothetical protein [Gemmataceae bacterium]